MPAYSAHYNGKFYYNAGVHYNAGPLASAEEIYGLIPRAVLYRELLRRKPKEPAVDWRKIEAERQAAFQAVIDQALGMQKSTPIAAVEAEQPIELQIGNYFAETVKERLADRRRTLTAILILAEG